MPRYFFNVHDGVAVPDESGTELPDTLAVRVAAVKAAGEAIRDLGDKFWQLEDWQLVVTDEQGRQILTLNFSGSIGHS